MVDGQFIQLAPVALRVHQGTVRETVMTALYALDSLGNVWKLMDQSGQKWMRLTGERQSKGEGKNPSKRIRPVAPAVKPRSVVSPLSS